jgi:hypothetical protein
MSSSKTDIVQSFRLRFWREPSQNEFSQWRGSIWHEQQRPGDEPAAVADAEHAFEIIRRVLHSGASIPAPTGGKDLASNDTLGCLPARIVQAICPLLAFYRRMWGQRP